MTGKRPTLADVASRAGTSTAVVSYVLNNGPRPVSDSLRTKVLAAIDDLEYAALLRRAMDRCSYQAGHRHEPYRQTLRETLGNPFDAPGGPAHERLILTIRVDAIHEMQ